MLLLTALLTQEVCGHNNNNDNMPKLLDLGFWTLPLISATCRPNPKQSISLKAIEQPVLDLYQVVKMDASRCSGTHNLISWAVGHIGSLD